MNATELLRNGPYVAVGIFGVGMVLRLLLTRWRREPNPARVLGAGLELLSTRKAFLVGWALLLAAHVALLAFPRAILKWNASPSRLYALEAVTALMGLVSLAGWVSVIWREFRGKRVSGLGGLFESAFLAMVFMGIVSGLAMAGLYRWSSMWGAATLAPYLQSLYAARPQHVLMEQMPFLVRLHVASGVVAFALIPFTRLGPALIATFELVVGTVLRPGVAVAAPVRQWMARHSPAALIWPEEEYAAQPLGTAMPSRSGRPERGTGRSPAAANGRSLVVGDGEAPLPDTRLEP